MYATWTNYNLDAWQKRIKFGCGHFAVHFLIENRDLVSLCQTTLMMVYYLRWLVVQRWHSKWTVLNTMCKSIIMKQLTGWAVYGEHGITGHKGGNRLAITNRMCVVHRPFASKDLWAVACPSLVPCRNSLRLSGRSSGTVHRTSIERAHTWVRSPAASYGKAPRSGHIRSLSRPTLAEQAGDGLMSCGVFVGCVVRGGCFCMIFVVVVFVGVTEIK